MRQPGNAARRERRRPLGALAVAGVLLAGCGDQPIAVAPGGGPMPAEESPALPAASGDGAPAAGGEGGGTSVSAAGGSGVPASAVDEPDRSGLEPVKRFRSVRDHEETPPPTDVRIPAIDVTTSLEHLGRDDDGAVEAPREWQRAGWFTEGARPGQPGPAIILGHVDSRAGPAVFYRLHQVRPGDEVLVDRTDGSTVTFVVERVERHGKDDFPTRAVYFPTLEPTLRLVTCGGEFDRRAGSYRDNIVVFATAAD